MDQHALFRLHCTHSLTGCGQYPHRTCPKHAWAASRKTGLVCHSPRFSSSPRHPAPLLFRSSIPSGYTEHVYICMMYVVRLTKFYTFVHTPILLSAYDNERSSATPPQRPLFYTNPKTPYTSISFLFRKLYKNLGTFRCPSCFLTI